jgi:sucrose phosphorylase
MALDAASGAAGKMPARSSSGALPRPWGPQLIVYADRFGGTLKGLGEILRTDLGGVFNGVHILPFYTPFDGVDAGFDPLDHEQVDPRLGTWDDVAALSERITVIADLIVNHISVASPQFQDFQRRGDMSSWAPMFLTMGDIFPNGASEQDLARIYRPRPGLPFTVMRLGGEPRLVWTTFTSEQVDLDIREALTWSYLTAVIDRLIGSGVSVIRLDAIGYAGKMAGTNCFMTSETFEFIDRIKEYCHQRRASILLEVHGHFSQQIEVARRVDLVYDFALPPLVLHAIFACDPGPLGRWLEVRPRNAITVLDTHDGIGVIDAGANGLRPSEPGLLDEGQIASLVESIHANAGEASRLATGGAASNLDLYQVNSTFFDALGRDERRYLLARAIQLFVPGIPQVYYVGLLAGVSDVVLFEQTGVGRDINRHHYTDGEIAAALVEPVVRAQIWLLRLRVEFPAFEGSFSHDVSTTRLVLRWSEEDHEALLDADLLRCSFTVRLTSAGKTRSVSEGQLLSNGYDGCR